MLTSPPPVVSLLRLSRQLLNAFLLQGFIFSHMVLSCKLNCCVVPHMLGRRKKRDGNWIMGSQSLGCIIVFPHFQNTIFSSSSFLTFVLLILLRSKEQHKNTVARDQRGGKTTYIRSSKLQQWAARLGSSSRKSSCVLQTAYLGLQSAPARLLSRHRGQKSLSNKLHFPELLRR